MPPAGWDSGKQRGGGGVKVPGGGGAVSCDGRGLEIVKHGARRKLDRRTNALWGLTWCAGRFCFPSFRRSSLGGRLFLSCGDVLAVAWAAFANVVDSITHLGGLVPAWCDCDVDRPV